jgi:prevent-host-death family protein
MRTVSLAEAKAKLSEMVTEASRGEVIAITRRGKIVARLTPAEAVKQPLDVDRLRQHLKTMPYDPQEGGDFVRQMREDDRY